MGRLDQHLLDSRCDHLHQRFGIRLRQNRNSDEPSAHDDAEQHRRRQPGAQSGVRGVASAGSHGIEQPSLDELSQLCARLFVGDRAAQQGHHVQGTPLQEFTVPNRGAMIHDLTERGASILRYKGSSGRLRVSMRRLDETLSTDDVPVHSFDRVEKLTPGAVVEVEIDLLPVGLVFHPGEQLRLVISAQNLFGPWMPALREYVPQNSGRHIIHTGGTRRSYLQLPVQTTV